MVTRIPGMSKIYFDLPSNAYIYTPFLFMKDARHYVELQPPNLTQSAAKSWFAAVLTLKIYLAALGIVTTSHSSNSILINHIIDSAPDNKTARKLAQSWQAAEDFHIYSYQKILFHQSEFPKRMEKVQFLVENLYRCNNQEVMEKLVERYPQVKDSTALPVKNDIEVLVLPPNSYAIYGGVKFFVTRSLKQMARNYPAPKKIVDSIRTDLTFDAGFKFEAKALGEFSKVKKDEQ